MILGETTPWAMAEAAAKVARAAQEGPLKSETLEASLAGIAEQAAQQAAAAAEAATAAAAKSEQAAAHAHTLEQRACAPPNDLSSPLPLKTFPPGPPAVYRTPLPTDTVGAVGSAVRSRTQQTSQEGATIFSTSHGDPQLSLVSSALPPAAIAHAPLPTMEVEAEISISERATMLMTCSGGPQLPSVNSSPFPPAVAHTPLPTAEVDAEGSISEGTTVLMTCSGGPQLPLVTSFLFPPAAAHTPPPTVGVEAEGSVFRSQSQRTSPEEAGTAWGDTTREPRSAADVQVMLKENQKHTQAEEPQHEQQLQLQQPQVQLQQQEQQLDDELEEAVAEDQLEKNAQQQEEEAIPEDSAIQRRGMRRFSFSKAFNGDMNTTPDAKQKVGEAIHAFASWVAVNDPLALSTLTVDQLTGETKQMLYRVSHLVAVLSGNDPEQVAVELWGRLTAGIARPTFTRSSSSSAFSDSPVVTSEAPSSARTAAPEATSPQAGIRAKLAMLLAERGHGPEEITKFVGSLSLLGA